MSQAISIDASAAALRIPGRVLNELCTHARETQPEECCGLVSGDETVRFRNVHRCRNDMTRQHEVDPESYPRDGRHAFHMNELDYMRAQKDAEEQGHMVTAVYHSHVAAGVYLSELDLQFANHALFPFPQASHIVVAVSAAPVATVLGAGIFERDESGLLRGRSLEAE